MLSADIGEDAECHAGKLLEVILLQCPGQVDQVSKNNIRGMGFVYILHKRPVNAQRRLHICAVLPEPSLLTHSKYNKATTKLAFQ